MHNYFIVIRLLILAEFRKQLKERKAGLMWLVLEPLFLILVFVLFLGEVLKKDSFEGPFSVAILVALLSWQAFSRTVFSGCNYQERYKYLLPYFRTSRLLLALPSIIYSHMYLLAALLMLLPLSLYYGSSIQISEVIIVFALQLLACWLVTSLFGFIYMKFQDIKPISGIVLRGMWFLSPILYMTDDILEHINNEFFKILFFSNPMILCIDLYRSAFGFDIKIQSGSIAGYLSTCFILIVAILFISLKLKAKKQVAYNHGDAFAKGSKYMIVSNEWPEELKALFRRDSSWKNNYLIYDEQLKLIPDLTLYENLLFFNCSRKLNSKEIFAVKHRISLVYDFNWDVLVKNVSRKELQIFRQVAQILSFRNCCLVWNQPKIYAVGNIKLKLLKATKEMVEKHSAVILVSNNDVFYSEANLEIYKLEIE